MKKVFTIEKKREKVEGEEEDDDDDDEESRKNCLFNIAFFFELQTCNEVKLIVQNHEK